MEVDDTGSVIDRAILEAQKAVSPLAKSEEGSTGKSKYMFVPGEVILAHGLEALHSLGVSWEVQWSPFDFLGAVWIRLGVRLCEPNSGESQERTYFMPVKGRGDPDKAFAGALTYCKGYAMAALCGIVREDEAKEHPDRRREDLGRDERPDYRASRPPRSDTQVPDQRERADVTGAYEHENDPVADFKRAIKGASVKFADVCEEAELTITTRPTDAELKQLWAAFHRVRKNPS